MALPVLRTGITPSQRTNWGSRVPPLNIQPLPSAKGALQVGEPSAVARATLSEPKRTIALSALPCALARRLGRNP
jgi:hypothetical protein